MAAKVINLINQLITHEMQGRSFVPLYGGETKTVPVSVLGRHTISLRVWQVP